MPIAAGACTIVQVSCFNTTSLPYLMLSYVDFDRRRHRASMIKFWHYLCVFRRSWSMLLSYDIRKKKYYYILQLEGVFFA